MKTIEARRLNAAEAAIETVVGQRHDGAELRFQLLEAVASRLGGFDLTVVPIAICRYADR